MSPGIENLPTAGYMWEYVVTWKSIIAVFDSYVLIVIDLGFRPWNDIQLCV